MIKILLKLISSENIEREYLSRFTEDNTKESLSEEERAVIMGDISKVENIESLLLDILKKDRIRFFNAPIESQGVIKGGFLRILWLLKELRKSGTGKKRSEKVKYVNPRYG